MACGSLSLLPAETAHLFASWCTATSCPTPPYKGLTSLRRPTSWPCPSSWCWKQQGQQCKVRKEVVATGPTSGKHQPLPWYRRALDPPGVTWTIRSAQNCFPTNPWRKELRHGDCPCGGVSSRQADLPLHPARPDLALRTLPTSGTVPPSYLSRKHLLTGITMTRSQSLEAPDFCSCTTEWQQKL